MQSELDVAIAEARERILGEATAWGRTAAITTAETVRTAAYVEPEMVEPTVSQLAFSMVAGCRLVHDSMTADPLSAPMFPDWLAALRTAFGDAANRECFDDDEDRSLYLKIVWKALAGLTVENMAGG